MQNPASRIKATYRTFMMLHGVDNSEKIPDATKRKLAGEGASSRKDTECDIAEREDVIDYEIKPIATLSICRDYRAEAETKEEAAPKPPPAGPRDKLRFEH
ncbi:hypothetical protein Tco_0674674 [Tanacetum coccineum]